MMPANFDGDKKTWAYVMQYIMQSIFSPPARQLEVVGSPKLSLPRRRTKNALQNTWLIVLGAI
jgi:hypothetical protein